MLLSQQGTWGSTWLQSVLLHGKTRTYTFSWAANGSFLWHEGYRMPHLLWGRGENKSERREHGKRLSKLYLCFMWNQLHTVKTKLLSVIMFGATSLSTRISRLGYATMLENLHQAEGPLSCSWEMDSTTIQAHSNLSQLKKKTKTETCITKGPGLTYQGGERLIIELTVMLRHIL